MRRPTAPRLTEHEARDASGRRAWWWPSIGHGRIRHEACCLCSGCQACRKAFVAGAMYQLPPKPKPRTARRKK